VKPIMYDPSRSDQEVPGGGGGGDDDEGEEGSNDRIKWGAIYISLDIPLNATVGETFLTDEPSSVDISPDDHSPNSSSSASTGAMIGVHVGGLYSPILVAIACALLFLRPV